MKGIIKTPYFVSGYTMSGSLEATIDEKTHTLITHHTDGDRTHIYHEVSKFDLFSLVKYIIMPYLLLTLDIWRMNIHSGLFWIAAAITVVVWHLFGRRKDRWIKLCLGSIAAALLISVAVVGVYTLTLATLWMLVVGAFVGWILYEIAIGIVSQEWQFMGKVFIYDNNRILAHYFTMPESQKSIAAEKVAIGKISKKIYFVVAFMAAIGLADVTAESMDIYRHVEANKAALSAQQEQDRLEIKMKEADARGDTQIVTTAIRVKQKPDIERVNKLLNVPDEYNVTKTKTYPWQAGYKHGGEWFFRDGVLISQRLTGGVKK